MPAVQLGPDFSTFLKRPALAVCARMLAAILSPNLDGSTPKNQGGGADLHIRHLKTHVETSRSILKLL